MNNETLKDKVVFGRKAKIETVSISYSTSFQFSELNMIKLTKGSPKETQTVYKLNLTDQKKKDICRKLNKMMGGY